MIQAAANEPAIEAIVSDSAYADALSRLERDVPAQGHLPAMFTPGGLILAQVLYGVDYYHAAPVAVIARIAPRPILLIHGADDNSTHKDTPVLGHVHPGCCCSHRASCQCPDLVSAWGQACSGLQRGGKSLR